MIHWKQMKLFGLCEDLNYSMCQSVHLTGAFYRVLNETGVTGTSPSALHGLRSKMGNKWEERRTEVRPSISGRAFHFHLYFNGQSLVTWPLAAREAGKFGFNFRI